MGLRGEVARRNRRAVIVEGQLAGHQDHHFCPQVDLHALGVMTEGAILERVDSFDHPFLLWRYNSFGQVSIPQLPTARLNINAAADADGAADAV